MIEDVSFVVITLNEEFAIKKCLGALEKLKLQNCEIICIDSGSRDRTVSIIKDYQKRLINLSLYVITGYSNSAIARNVGIGKVTKKYIFFIDGDIELCPGFVEESIKQLQDCDAVTGDLEENYYDNKYKDVIKHVPSRLHILRKKKIYYSGGTFIAKLSQIKSLRFFNENFERSQDFEYTLRFAKRYIIYALPITMGIHHTIPYYTQKRILNSLKIRGGYIYSGIIFRNNINNFKGLLSYIKEIRRILLGVIFWVTILCFLFFSRNKGLIVAAALSIFILDMVVCIFQRKNLLLRVVYRYIAPFYFFIGLFSRISISNKFTVIKVGL